MIHQALRSQNSKGCNCLIPFKMTIIKVGTITLKVLLTLITFKILLFVFKSLNGLAPFYLSDLISTYVPSRSLRSASLSLLHVPGSNQKTYGDRAFAVAAPRLWNALPIQMRQPGTALDTFKRSLKTLLFKQAFYRFL